jgi:hypothetical protein
VSKGEGREDPGRKIEAREDDAGVLRRLLVLNDEAHHSERPKGTDPSVFSQAALDGIADSLNSRPRATHDGHTPLEVFAQTLASSHRPSTSVH